MQTAFIRTLVSSYFLSRSFKLGANSIQENIWKEIIYERLPKKKLAWDGLFIWEENQ